MLAALLETRTCSPQTLAAAPGMAHQLRAAGWNRRQQLHQLRRPESTGDLEAREVVLGAAAAAREREMELPPHQPHAGAGGALDPWNPAAQRIQRKIERTPYPPDPELFADSRHRIEDRRRQVGVLVRIQMGRPD